MRRSIPAEVEARTGLSFWHVVRDLCDEGLTPAQAARRLGYAEQNPKNGVRTFMNLLNRHPEHDPWGARSPVARYQQKTGEAFGDAVRRLAQTHTASAAARELGFSGSTQLRYALRARGIEVAFQTQPRIPDEAVERYIRLRLERVPACNAARTLGYSRHSLSAAARRRFPQLTGKLPAPDRTRRLST